MNEFDEYILTEVQRDLDEQNKWEGNSDKPRNKTYDRIQVQLDRARKKYKKITAGRKFVEFNEEEKEDIISNAKYLKELSKTRAKTPSLSQNYRTKKILYVRYADDWIILTNMRYKESLDLKEFMSTWLEETFKLKLSKSKTKITNLKTNQANFLGFSLKTYQKRRISKNKYGEMTKRAGWNITIGVDVIRALEKLQYKGFCNAKFKPVAKRSWATLEPEEIINRYNYLSRGIANYYFPVVDRLTAVSRLLYITKFSCLSTFAKKYK